MTQTSRRELNKLQCRQRILQTSCRMFSAAGYDDTTMEQVAQGAMVSRATLYNYFPNKESLLLGLAQSELEKVRRDMEEQGAEPRALNTLRRVLGILVCDATRYQVLSRKITCLSARPNTPLNDARLEMEQLLSRLTAEAQTQGDLRRDRPAQELTDLFMGLFFMAQFQWSGQAACPETLDRYLEDLLKGIQS